MRQQRTKSQLKDFSERIYAALNLSIADQKHYHQRKEFALWLKSEQMRLKSVLEKDKVGKGLIKRIFQTSNKANLQQIQESLKQIGKLKQMLKQERIPEEFLSTTLEMPDKMKTICSYIKEKQFNKPFYAYLRGPIIMKKLIKSREDLNSTIQKVIVNGIKFMVIQQKVCDKFQRNFLQEIFGRVFRAQGSLSIVIKIQIQDDLFEAPSSFYCYLQDIYFQSKIVWKPLTYLKSKGQQIIVEHETKTYNVAEISILENLLSEIFITPLQTLIPQYVIEIRQENALLIKHYNMDQKSREQSSKKLKNYSSLRNPLFYFKHFIKEKQISIDKVKQIVINRDIYKRFFDALNMIVIFLKDDFWFEKGKVLAYSLAFAKQSFQIMWEVFHNIILLSKWLEQTIRPLKETVTIFQILQRFCPIFNFMSSFQANNIEQYMKFLEQLEIQSYMTTYISKTAINKYKQMLIYKQLDFHQQYANNDAIFAEIFEPLISEIDFNHVQSFQMAYILNFTCRNKKNLSKNALPKSWHNHKLWKKMYQQVEYSKPLGLDCYLDMMGFYLGINVIQISQKCFELIKYQQQNKQFIQKIQDFIKMLEKQEDQCLKDSVLALLTEKAFKYHKCEIATKILSLGGTIKDYSQIFDLEFEQLENQVIENQKKNVINNLKQNYPQIYRKYQWQYLMRVQLKNSKGEDKTIETINYGRCWLEKQLFNTVFGDEGFILQNVSRKDYMYGEKEISKIASSKHTQFYIQKLQYPTVPLFYSIALNRLGLSHMSSNFTLFINDKGVFQLSETIPKAITFKKALSQYNQNDIKLFINKNALCEAAIVSMIFMPYKLQLKDLILETFQEKSNLFIINFREFYQSRPIIKNGSGYSLKCINCLFTMDIMQKDIDFDIIKKYSQINVDNYVKQLFEELALKMKEISQSKKKLEKNCFTNQLPGMIFQEDFILNITERMFKIKRTFEKCLISKKSINLMKLLQQISQQLCYFYEQVISSSNSLIQRENLLLDQMWTKSFITETNLFSFLASTSRVQQPVNLFPNHHRKFCFPGPSQSLDILKNNLKKFEVYRERFLEKNWHKQKTEVIQYYLMNVDLSVYKIEDRFKFYQSVKDKSNEYLIQGKNILPLNIIRVSSMEFIKNNKQLLHSFSYERVNLLYLHDCQIASTTINSLVQKLDNLSYLSLKNIKSLQYIQASTFQSDIQFKNLKTLIISQCHNLETINIKCDILEDVVIRDNQSMCDIYISSFNLRNMNCSKSPKLNFENIGIYILKGINVLLCRSCCYGDAQKLFHDNYIIYLTNILQYLISKCSEKQSKNKIQQTISKFDFAREGISLNNSSILTNIFGDTSEQTAMTLAQLYLINSRINCLHISYLTQNNSIILKLFNAILKNKLLKIHPIREIIIENPSNQIDKLTGIVQACLLDKHFTITLKNLTKGNEQIESSIVKAIKSKNSSLQKMVLAIKDSKLTSSFIKNVVTQPNQQLPLQQSSEIRNKITRITKIFLQKTEINIELSNISFKNLIKLVIKNCCMHSIQFVKNATTLKQFKIINTAIDSPIQILYSTLFQLKTIRIFHFVQMKKKTEKIEFPQLFKILNQLPKLQDVDFSGNDFTDSDVRGLDNFCMENSTIRSLTLYNFYKQQSNINFSKFLSKNRLKAVEIEFQTEEKLAQFIQSISNNTNLMRLKIKVNFQISSPILVPLKKNKTIQEITSNQLLPMWLKQYLKHNNDAKYAEKEFQQLSSFPTKTLQYYKMGLSLDGGGIRGTLLAAELEYIQKQVGYPLHKIFDYVGGTSIGGILALASTGTIDGIHTICSGSELVNMFEQYGNKIFKKDTMRQFTSLFDTKYTGLGIQSVLKNYFKDCRLSQVMQQTNVLVTAVNRLDNKDVIFKSMEAILHREKDFYMRDVGRATSAAPIYFPSAEIKNIEANVKYSLIDGGIGLNNPGKLVIDQIKKMAFNEGSEKSYFLISLGTGRTITDIIPQTAGIKDIAPIIESFSQSSSYFVQRDLRQNYKGHVIRISPQIDLKKSQTQLDRVQPQIIKYYKQLAYQVSKKQFSKTITYGRYRNKSLIDWLRQNTEKKHDL